MGKSKRKKQEITNSAYGLDAGAYSPAREFNMFPVVARQDITTYRRRKIISRARSLYYNSPEIRAAVKTLAMLVGALSPLPLTADEQWNKLAVKAFDRRVNGANFELTGSLNFEQFQNYAEEQAIVDGDVLVVLTTDKDGGGIAVYPADMLDDQVILDDFGRPLYYIIKDGEDGKRIKASACVMYRHNPDPTDPRGLTDLIAAITTAQDLYELNSYHKQSVKLSASIGIVETVDNAVKRTDVSDLDRLRNGGGVPATSQASTPLNVNGVKAYTMSPGHDLKVIADNRPSNEVRAFAQDMVDAIAHSVGLDPEILYRVKEMGSASVRFAIQKAKDWAKPRKADKAQLCTRIWRHIISCEIAAGRLRQCNDKERAYDVDWIGKSEWSIDRSRDTNSAISLMREGLMSKDEFCLEQYGKPYSEILESNVKNAALLIDRCKEAGIPIALVEPGQVGSAISKDEITSQPSAAADGS